MTMLHWMCSFTRLDKIRNEVIREKVQVTTMQEKMVEGRLRWFRTYHMSTNTPVKRFERIDISNYKRGRGRPRTGMRLQGQF